MPHFGGGGRSTVFFWDLEDCPVPDGLTAEAVWRNMRRALANNAGEYLGRCEITGFGDFSLATKHDGIGMIWSPLGDRRNRQSKILVEFLCRAIRSPSQTKFVLILGDISGHSGFLTAFRRLKLCTYENHVILAQPRQTSVENLHGISSLWHWSSLSDAGGRPFYRFISDDKGKGKETHCDEEPYVSAKTLVFWDMVDCQIPDGLDAAVVSQNIGSALAKHGTVSIYAYGDTNQKIQGLESSGIVFRHSPAGDKDARLEKIIVDFLCCAIGNPDIDNLMLIVGDLSGHSEFELAANLMSCLNFTVFLAQPQNASQQLLDAVPKKWLWSSLSAGGREFYQWKTPQAILDYPAAGNA